MVHTLALCGTCPRDGQPAVAPLVAELRGLFAASTLAGDYELPTLHCLGACCQPCTVAFTAPGKWRLRFSRLRPLHLAPLLATAELYRRSPDGLIALHDLPGAMVGCFSAASPESLLRTRSLAAPPACEPVNCQDLKEA